MSETHSNLATWKNRSEVSIAQGALTNSKKPSCFVKGVYPTHLVRGKGAYVWDDRGRRYIDFICALGTNLFGYANRDYTTAVISALELGVLYSLGSTKEVEFAERVQEYFSVCRKN
jgi:Glutamate-1-semialdehyde aminotransferase